MHPLRWTALPALLLPALLLLLTSGCGAPPDAEEGPGNGAKAAPAGTPEPDIRPEVGGMNGAVVSGHPLAAQAGYEVLRQGGNAVDAAVTMAAILAVVRPHMNSVGGDAFALFYDASTGEVTALNASGRSAALATPEFYAEQGLERMPGIGPLSVTVPGAVSAWSAALERYGTLSFSRALQPAIQAARDGFMVSRTLAEDLYNDAARLNEAGQAIYRPGDRPLESGELLRSPALAGTLEQLADQGPGALYGGPIGETLAAFLEAEGSPLRASDFAAHTPEWTTPISIPFQGRVVHTVPPNSQGLVLLQMLGMAEALPLDRRTPNSPELLHELVEIKKLAFADRDRWIADPAFGEVPVDRMLDLDYLRRRAGLIPARAAEEDPEPGFGGELVALFMGEGEGPTDDGDTVYLMAVDRWGNAVSWIQSLFSSFGSRLVEPTTGVVLQNRGSGFTLQEDHPNRVAPGKRPLHTLMATMVTGEDGSFEMTVGTPGGAGQPQFIAQTLVQALAFGLSPQHSIEAPRFRSGSGAQLAVEARIPAPVRGELERRGHALDVAQGWTANFGNMQMIHRLPSGMLRTGADMRREGAAMAY